MSTNVEFEVDLTYLIYQPVSDWLKAVEEKHGKAVSERCSEIITQLGASTDTMVSDLGKDRLEIIIEALQAPS